MSRPKTGKGCLATLALLAAAALAFFLFHEALLKGLGGLIVRDDTAVPSDAIVVLHTGVEAYPRLIEAARLYRDSLADTVVVNGGRKSDTLRSLESKGYRPCCPWQEDVLRIFSLLGVPRKQVLAIDAPDAFDTISEAGAVGAELTRRGMRRILLTTSKYHSRRAAYIWNRMYRDQLSIRTVAAASDPFDPSGWWRDGRQIRWMLAEYGAWVYYWWQCITLN
jgi:uncharacterized SAM-binding protein YcdF (DUF218 family)